MSPEVEELVRLVCSFVADKAVNEPLRYQQWNDVETENIRNDFVTTEVKCRQIFFGAESQTDEKSCDISFHRSSDISFECMSGR